MLSRVSCALAQISCLVYLLSWVGVGAGYLETIRAAGDLPFGTLSHGGDAGRAFDELRHSDLTMLNHATNLSPTASPCLFVAGLLYTLLLLMMMMMRRL